MFMAGSKIEGAPQMCITRETKWHPLCCCQDTSFAAGAVLIKTEIPNFVLKQEPSTPTNLMMGVKTIWELSVRSRTLCLTEEVENGNICFFDRETGAKKVAMATALRVSFWFFCDAHLWCQVSRTLLQYFQRYPLFSISPLLVANNVTSSLI